MRQGKSFLKFSVQSFVTVSFFSVCTLGWGQASTMPDAQIEANVLKALANSPQLAGQPITTTTVYGTVTLSGSVQDEPSRDAAEHLVANTAGVQKVVDELIIGAAPTAGNSPANGQPAAGGTNPNLQSDGTVAP